ncbi:MAG: hypothetical protein M4579_003526 [Chaenotheca gracillima]|nr:MAG: hypothetical protein M4579_003526 [Chaenotheca gracillima]
MSSVNDIPQMKARTLTIMATRAQDQDLVKQVAETHGRKDSSEGAASEPHSQERVVPSFGWHPWFSHQLYDDTDSQRDLLDGQATVPAKDAHYRDVLRPPPSDPAFLASLPEPSPMSAFLARTRANLEAHPSALVGEIGLDRAFRLPTAWDFESTESRDAGLTPGGREGRRLTPHRVSLEHQKRVLRAQLRLAGEMERAVSVHGVQAHGAVFDVLKEMWRGWEKEVVSKRKQKKARNVDQAHPDDEELRSGQRQSTVQISTARPFPARICLHSYSGPPESLKQYFDPAVPADIFFSFSSVINFSSSAAEKAMDVIKAVPNESILVESDLHCAGEEMDRRLEEMVSVVCKIKDWNLNEGVEQLGKNWKRFVHG